MKKYLLSALALPLLFACSSEDYLDQKATDNDQFAGIEKVDATFSMAESPKMRMDNVSWKPEEGDKWGFAWMTDAHTATPAYSEVISIDGKAYQNHNLIQTDGIFKPQTSIYVGKYYLYRPYDSLTVSPKAIDFNSLKEQPLADGYDSDQQPWINLAKTAINIGDKFTEVTPEGHTIGTDPTIWDNAGTKGHYKLNGAFFSNQTGLDLTYQNNNVEVPAAGMPIAGATDINYKYPAGTKIGAAAIYKATVQLAGAANSFTYAPTREPNADAAAPHDGAFWANKKDLNTNKIADASGKAFTWASGTGFDVITLKAADENGVSTDKADHKGWFWFNSLPITAGNGGENVEVTPILETSYGQVTVLKEYPSTKYTVKDCAYEGIVESKVLVWHPLADAADPSKTPTVLAIGSENTFINQYGNHKGKFALTVDFSKGVMNGMHIKNDAHLQKLLKYYIAAGKTETGAVLNLDKDADGVFKISKLSIALLQTINATTEKVKVQACTVAGEKPSKIIVTQDGQVDLGLANAKEVPALNKVFATPTDVYLSKDCEWTWTGGGADADYKKVLAIDNNVKSITNEGTLTVNAVNVEMTTVVPAATLANAAGATMNITKVTTVKNALTNLGTINVGASENKKAELRAYGVAITNDATGLKDKEFGVINNYGVVGVTDGTLGTFNNYGLIDMKDGQAITLLTTNELVSNFDNKFDKSTNKMGTVQLPDNNPTAIVSVNNKDANGFIKYPWPASQTTYVTPEGNVKYNTIVVSGNIKFTEIENEIQYVVFDGTRTQVVNNGYLKNLKGVIVNANRSIIIEKGNKLIPSDGTFLGTGATVYNGGTFTHNAAPVSGTTVSNYFGEWSTDQIVKY